MIMEYSDEIIKLQRRLFRLISENLGLEADYLEEALGEPHQNLLINYYCPCPQPELALGVRVSNLDFRTALVELELFAKCFTSIDP
jgi:isopenicillin N synthase-like dioxygenase